MLRLVVILAAVLAVRGQTTAVNRCTWHSGELPINVSIDNCETPPCQLPQLQDFVVNISFRAPRTLQRMTTHATLFLTGLSIPLPYYLGAKAVTCNYLQNSSCPVPEGEVIHYQLRMFIESHLTVNMDGNFEFIIVDPSDYSTITCIRVPIRVVPPVQGRDATMVGRGLSQNTK